jgi:uncharacterized protein (TIGR01244 family)
MSRNLFTLLILASAVACASGEGVDPTPVALAAEAQPATQTRPAAQTQPAAGAPAGASHVVGLPNERMPAAGLLTGGQVTREQMTELAEMGYSTFVSLRPVSEEGAGWEEEFAASQGMTLVRIPVGSAEDLTRENARILADTLAEADGKAVVYCKSGNRVGALLALKAHWIDEESAEEALAFGRDAGLTRMEPVVQKILAEQE